ICSTLTNVNGANQIFAVFCPQPDFVRCDRCVRCRIGLNWIAWRRSFLWRSEFVNFSKVLDCTVKTVLVTGGSAGIGYGIARAFCDLGAHVTVTGTRDVSAYEADFSGLQFIRMNVCEPESVTALAARFPALDVLVNC